MWAYKPEIVGVANNCAHTRRRVPWDACREIFVLMIAKHHPCRIKLRTSTSVSEPLRVTDVWIVDVNNLGALDLMLLRFHDGYRSLVRMRSARASHNRTANCECRVLSHVFEPQGPAYRFKSGRLSLRLLQSSSSSFHLLILPSSSFIVQRIRPYY